LRIAAPLTAGEQVFALAEDEPKHIEAVAAKD